MHFCLSLLQVDRVSYLLQEIYGIENKNNQETKVPFSSVHAQLPCFGFNNYALFSFNIGFIFCHKICKLLPRHNTLLLKNLDIFSYE